MKCVAFMDDIFDLAKEAGFKERDAANLAMMIEDIKEEGAEVWFDPEKKTFTVDWKTDVAIDRVPFYNVQVHIPDVDIDTLNEVISSMYSCGETPEEYCDIDKEDE